MNLLFLWHFHQPLYKDLALGKFLMPWVRLHGIKDYTGMAMLLKEFPEIRCAVNFSGVLLAQLQDYARRLTDVHFDWAGRDPKVLTDDEKDRIRHDFFLVNPERSIQPHPRYRELLEKKVYSPADWIDLQVLANLVWFHPLLIKADSFLSDLRRKGRGYTSEERAGILSKQHEILERVLPRWQGLQESGQVEISMSPFYHPIMPLLCDPAIARMSRPDTILPELACSLTSDALLHMRRSRELASTLFRNPVLGCWPSEGGVSEEALRLCSRHGFRWVATDEQILARSLGVSFERNAEGVPANASALYRPYRFGDLAIFFRDRLLADLIGFHYKTWEPQKAAADFVGRLERIAGAVPEESWVTIALDGENAWEHYPENGVSFLRALYRRLSEHPTLRTRRFCDALKGKETFPGLTRLHAGSWINGDFHVWIGHEEDRRGWQAVSRARAELERREGELSPTSRDRAWECVLAAEGSDWYWWFGEDYSSRQDVEFDALFRRHLSNAYRAMGAVPPEDLLHPIKKSLCAEVYRKPEALLHVVLDGRRTDYFEWMEAGRYDMSREYGALSGELSFLSTIYFGCDRERFLLRCDFRDRETLSGCRLGLVVVAPGRRNVAFFPPSGTVQAVCDEILEMAVPLSELGVQGYERLEFYLEVERTGMLPVRIPSSVSLSCDVPARDYDTIHWTV